MLEMGDILFMGGGVESLPPARPPLLREPCGSDRVRLCPGGGGGGLFLDRVELAPGARGVVLMEEEEEGEPGELRALPWFLGGSGGPSTREQEELRSVEVLYTWLVKAL